MKLYSKIIYKGTLELITGLHIGDSKESTDIGGVDSPVVRRKDNNQPYIPGSSLKGKIRSLLEISQGKRDTFKEGNHIIGELFGSINNENANPSRIIFRDANMNEKDAERIKNSEFYDIPYTEVKMENVINRVKGTAEHPRQIERVPAGTIFDIEFVVNIFADSEDSATSTIKKYQDLITSGLKLLEDDYLGGSGSRGYGQVKLKLESVERKTKDYYGL
jgi:CRISPR-associated protein Csm3